MRAKLPQSLIQHYQPASTIGLPYVDSLLAFMIALDDKEEEEEDKEEEMKWKCWWRKPSNWQSTIATLSLGRLK